MAVRVAMAQAAELDATLAADLQQALSTLNPADLAKLQSMHSSDKHVADCFFVQAHLVYYADGVVRPCCDATIEPVGTGATSAREILRGEKLRRLATEFSTGRLRPDCARCPMHQMVPERQIFPIAFQ